MPDRLSQTFAALADPTRRAMLSQLAKGEANVSDLAKPFAREMSLPAVTKHLKVLEKAGLITKGRQAQWRPCRLNGDALKPATDWMDDLRQYWEESLDRLDEYLQTVVAQQTSAEKASAAKTTTSKEPAKGKKHAPTK